MDFLLQQIDNMDLRFEAVSAVRLAFSLVIGGLLAIYIQFLYRRCSRAASSNSNLIVGVFPLLTLATIAVIAVVKSSLALSLGLVGALSIVRFRAAIKDPEQLVYLFVCIAVGLALGAEKILLAVTLVFVASGFLLGRHYLFQGAKLQDLLLTISGNADEYFSNPDSGALKFVNEFVESYTIQRFEVDNGQGMLRLVVTKSDPAKAIEMVTKLREQLDGCHISYVNLDAAI